MNIFDRPTSKELLEAVLGFVNEEIERLQMKVAKKLGYKLVDHRMELFGKKIPK